jgi:transcriptional regulator with GAF, ATPase, and Fis domain
MTIASELEARAEELEARALSLETEKRALEEEFREMSRRFVDLERQNTHLASLFVASYQLLSSADRDDVLTAIQEIVTNLVGSEEVAIYECDRSAGELVLAASRGLDADRLRRVPIGSGVIGRVAATGSSYLAPEDGTSSEEWPDLTACIALRVADQVAGVVAIFRLLPQKNGFTRVDEELFDLLSTQAAGALSTSHLRARLGVAASPGA